MFKRFRLVNWFCFVVSISLIFTACDKGKKSPLIGVILATTGNAAFIGKPEKAVLEKLRGDYIKHGIKIYGLDFLFFDSGGDPEKALASFEMLEKTPNVIAIIGPSTSGESISLAKIANEEEIPLLSLAASKKIVRLNDGVNPWAFKFAQNDDLVAQRLIMKMTKLEHFSVALLSSEDGFGKSGADVFREAAKNSNIQIIHQASFPPSLESPEALVLALPREVQGVVIWGTAPGPELLVKTLKKQNIPAQIYLSHGNASEAFIESCGVASEEAIVAGSRVLTAGSKLDPNSTADEIIRRYRAFWQENFPGEPSHFAAYARDAFGAILAVLPKVDLSICK